MYLQYIPRFQAKSLALLCLLVLQTYLSFAQTGPGGVGNSATNALWLDASRLTGLNNGAKISQWADVSGNNRHALQSAAANQPSYLTGALNGRPVLRFDRSQAYQYLRINSSAIGSLVNNSNTLIAVAKANTGGADGNKELWQGVVSIVGYHGGMYFGGYPLANTLGYMQWLGGTYPAVGANVPTELLYTGGAITQQNWVVGTQVNRFTTGATTLEGFNNGTTTGLTSSTKVPTNYQNNVISIGTGFAPSEGSEYRFALNGDIAEIIAFSQALTPTQRIIVENYLAAKYNLTVANDYYTSHDPAYTHDVQGIGTTDGVVRHSQAGSGGGLRLTETNGSLNAANEFLFSGHKGIANQIVTTNLAADYGLVNRWERDWYLQKTGEADALLSFDFAQAGLTVPTNLAATLGNYRLLYRAYPTDNFTVVPGAGPVAFGNNGVAFGVSSGQLRNGYYTLGYTQDNQPLALTSPQVIQIDGKPATPTVQAGSMQYELLLSTVEEANRYQWQIDDDPAFGSINLATSSAVTQILIRYDQLMPGTLYYVRTQAERLNSFGQIVGRSNLAGAPVTAFRHTAPLGAITTQPDEKRNMVVVNTVLVEGRKTEASLQGLTVAQMHQQISYTDGLGRPVQQVLKQGSPTLKDIVQPVDYDQYGMTPKNYLPYVSSSSDGKFKTDALHATYTNSAQYLFYQSLAGVTPDTQPFSASEYESSPLNTVLQAGSIGKTWNPATVGGEGKTVKPAYRTNTAADNVRSWTYIPSGNESFGAIESPGFYAAGKLMVSEVKDQEDNLVWQFTDLLGRVVLKRAWLSANDYLDTYQVYDEFGSLRAVIQPKGTEGLPASGSWSADNAFLDKWCFTFSYDARKRPIEKRVPGAGPEYFVYNQRDELVLSQDANLRSRGLWAFSKYDQLGRVILTGTYQTTKSRATMQGEIDYVGLQLPREGNRNYEFRQTGFTYHYTNHAYPVLAPNDEVYSITYYDDYDFDNNGTADKTYSTALDDQLAAPPRPRYLTGTTRIIGTDGLMTGSKVRVLGSSPVRWLETVVFYDEDYQPIQVQATNHKGGLDIATTQYDFAGRTVKTVSRHINPADPVRPAGIVTRSRPAYDHMGRVLAVYHQIDSKPEEKLLQLQYNELGQSISKTVGTQNLQKIDYTFNIRGWLLRMNNPANLNTGGEKDLFAMEFSYGLPPAPSEGGGVPWTGRADGNITAVRWKSALDGIQRGYNYTYDGMSRLTDATYTHNNPTVNEQFSVTGMGYDKNGNITALTRFGLTARNHNSTPVYGRIDALTSNPATDFDGNKLLKVTDAQATQGLAGDFRDGANTNSDYTYDTSGNLLTDNNKGITGILYNALNLPVRISFDNAQQNYIEYTYDASGSKTTKKLYQGGVLKQTTDYLGGYVYQDSELQYVHTPEGRYVFSLPPAPSQGGGVGYYEYHYTDQLGQVRVAFRDPGPAVRYTATMEDAAAATENASFANVATTRNGTRACTGSKAARVNSGRVLGPWKTIAVGKGDQVTAFARAVYQAAPTGSNTSLSLYLTNAGSGASSGGESSNKLSLLQVGVGYTPTWTQPTDKPRAYLQYIFYDKNERFVSQQIYPVSEAANVCQELQLQLTAPEDGYVQVLVANESSTDVWFDDIEITYTPSMIVQEAHYDPWGMSLTGIEKEGSFGYLFNLSEKQKDPTGSGYFYETDWRGYDPQIGRFRGIDVYAGSMPGITPYQYAFNNPVMMNDPTGEFPGFMIAGAVIGGIAGGLHSKNNGGSFWDGAWKGALIGAAIGAGLDLGLGNFSNGGTFNYGFGSVDLWGATKTTAVDPWQRVPDPLAARGSGGSSIVPSSGESNIGSKAINGSSAAGNGGHTLLAEAMKKTIGNINVIRIVIHHGDKFADKGWGGKWGGHVMINFGDDQMYGFTGGKGENNSQIHDSYRYGTFSNVINGDGKRLGGLTSVFEIPTSTDKFNTIKGYYESNAQSGSEDPTDILYNSYWNQGPYDYELFGRRCASSCYFELKKAGIIQNNNPLNSLFNAFTPGRFFDYLYRNGYYSNTYVQKGGLKDQGMHSINTVNYYNRTIKKAFKFRPR